MQARLEPVFLEGFHRGRRFGLWVWPPGNVQPKGALLCVQPFGDEANLSRRVLVAQACRLAQAGWVTLMIDLFGTGDSDGATAEAMFTDWRSDLLRASHLVRERVDGPFVLWGTRMGTLLAAEVASALDQLTNAFVFWQPAATGAALLDPLLKLAKIGSIAHGATVPRSAPQTADTERSAPATHDDGTTPIDLAGYRVRGDLVAELRALTMQIPTVGPSGSPCPVLLLGIQRVLPPGESAPRALADLAGRWLAEGHLPTLRVVRGEPFWSSLEPSTPLAAFEVTEAFLGSVDATT